MDKKIRSMTLEGYCTLDEAAQILGKTPNGRLRETMRAVKAITRVTVASKGKRLARELFRTDDVKAWGEKIAKRTEQVRKAARRSDVISFALEIEKLRRDVDFLFQYIDRQKPSAVPVHSDGQLALGIGEGGQK